MIEKIETMPPGTIGFRASGKLTRRDYRDVLEPVLRGAAESGEIRMLFEIADFDPGEVRVYGVDARDEALAWVSS